MFPMTLREFIDLCALDGPHAALFAIVHLFRSLEQREQATCEGTALGIGALEAHFGTRGDPEATLAKFKEACPRLLDVEVPDRLLDWAFAVED
jgi:hypothetical protein